MDTNPDEKDPNDFPPDVPEEVILTDKDREMMEKREKAHKGFRKRIGFPPKSGTKVSLAQCLQVLKDHNGWEREAAKSLKISFSCWKNYKKKWPELEELANEFMEQKTEKVLKTAYREATKKEEPNDRLIRFWLDRKGQAFGFEKQFKDEKPTQIQVNIGTQISMHLTDDVKQNMLDVIKRKRMDEQDRIKMDNALEEQKEQKIQEGLKEIPLLEEKKDGKDGKS